MSKSQAITIEPINDKKEKFLRNPKKNATIAASAILPTLNKTDIYDPNFIRQAKILIKPFLKRFSLFFSEFPCFPRNENKFKYK